MNSSTRPLSLTAFTLLLGGLVLSSTCQTQAAASADANAELKARVDRLTNDWPGLARYHRDNASLPAPVKGETRVVFLGDSITDAWPQADAFFSTHGYIGRGISGQTTPQMLLRMREDVIALHPSVVVILAGTNDVAQNTGPYDPVLTQGYIASMVELAHGNGIRVVLSSVLPAYAYPWSPAIQPVPKIAALNAWMRDYAAHNACGYLDYFSAMADARQGLPAALSADGVHPNPAGYAVMESLVVKAIDDAPQVPCTCCADAMSHK